MLQHLLDLSEVDYLPDVDTSSRRPFMPVEDLDAAAQLDARAKTTDLFDRLGAVDDDTVRSAVVERQSTEAFVAMIGDNEEAKLEKVGALTLPEAVRDSVRMLSQYQWRFVEQAAEIRSMAVSKLVKETDHPDAKVRLKALELVGKVTEVALFTDRVKIEKSDISDAELEAKLREKLAKFAARVIPAQDTTVIDAEIKDPALRGHTQESAT